MGAKLQSAALLLGACVSRQMPCAVGRDVVPRTASLLERVLLGNVEVLRLGQALGRPHLAENYYFFEGFSCRVSGHFDFARKAFLAVLIGTAWYVTHQSFLLPMQHYTGNCAHLKEGVMGTRA